MLPEETGRLKVALPPMPVRLQETAIPVELAAGVMLAVSVELLPAATEAGLAEPVPLSDTMQVLAVLELLRGAGVALEKSELFAFVSVQPPPARKAARMFVSADAAVPSEQFADP